MRALTLAPTFVATAVLAAEPASLTLAVEPAEITVGDPVTVTVSMTLRDAESPHPIFPTWGATWGDAEVLEVSEIAVTTGAAGRRFDQMVRLTAFRPGELELPPVAVRIPVAGGDHLESAGGRLTVRSVLPGDGAEPEPLPAEGTRELPLGRPFWSTLAVLGALCLTASLLLARRVRGAPESVPDRAIDPLDALDAALDALRDETDAVRFHAGLSLALRRFLGRALEVNAVESTTTEIHRHLRRLDLPTDVTTAALRLLRAADLVKFARRGTSVNRDDLDRAGMLARAALAAMTPPPPDEAREAAA